MTEPMQYPTTIYFNEASMPNISGGNENGNGNARGKVIRVVHSPSHIEENGDAVILLSADTVP